MESFSRRRLFPTCAPLPNSVSRKTLPEVLIQKLEGLREPVRPQTWLPIKSPEGLSVKVFYHIIHSTYLLERLSGRQ